MGLTGAPPAEVGTRRSTILLWMLALGPPVVWAIRFALSYALVPLVCLADFIVVLHVITVVTLSTVLGLGWLSSRFWQSTRVTPEHVDDAVMKRARFMALFGMMSAALFTLVIIAEGLANVMIDPCLTSGPLMPH